MRRAITATSGLNYYRQTRFRRSRKAISRQKLDTVSATLFSPKGARARRWNYSWNFADVDRVSSLYFGTADWPDDALRPTLSVVRVLTVSRVAFKVRSWFVYFGHMRALLCPRSHYFVARAREGDRASSGTFSPKTAAPAPSQS